MELPQFPDRWSYLSFLIDGATSVLEVRNFISGMLHAAENHIMLAGNLIQRKLAKLMICKNHSINFASFDHDTLIGSAEHVQLSIQFMKIMKSRDDKTHPCQKQTFTQNDFDCTRT